ncbi:hypothetical protein [Cognatishimia activa]|uniref:hypothetical protein n=1 Tax=Cognatishimia activa TaxID=1715691 RepID=UPI00223041E3|nr:hypothetical protein [Cognatishimia activa]UZD91166.1 hypothetical protein M0D42_00710 [Cognatishimia activa]
MCDSAKSELEANEISHLDAKAKAEVREFALLEWGSCRDQLNALLSAIWRLEITVISGYAVFYAWLLGKMTGKTIGFDPTVVLFASTAFSMLIFIRLKVEYGILLTLGNYSKKLESFLYHKVGCEAPESWEHYLKEHRPDRLWPWEVFFVYWNTGLIFLLLFCFNLFMFLWLSEVDFLSLFWPPEHVGGSVDV